MADRPPGYWLCLYCEEGADVFHCFGTVLGLRTNSRPGHGTGRRVETNLASTMPPRVASGRASELNVFQLHRSTTILRAADRTGDLRRPKGETFVAFTPDQRNG